MTEREFTSFKDVDEEILITCKDGDMLRGLIESIEDEDGSGIDEPGITIVRPDNSYLIIGLSEIKNIEIIPKVGDRNGKR